MSSTRAALEAALAADPDDLAAHAAYADLLAEEGDPRGDYIQLQLAAEDHDQTADRIATFNREATDLRQRHAADWLGPLTAFEADRKASVEFYRGWVHRVQVGQLTDELAAALAAAPLARLMQELVIESNMRPHPVRRRGHAVPGYIPLDALAGSPNVANLRRLELGGDDSWHAASFDTDLGNLLKTTPRLDTLTVAAHHITPARVFFADLPRLRTLRVVTNNNRLPIALLGQNKHLGALETIHLDVLAFMPPRGDIEAEREPVYPDEVRAFAHSGHLTGVRYLALRLPGFGDAGVDELVNSPMMGRLRGLDLCRCMITDEGAEALAAHPATPKLEYLRLDDNYLSPVGIDALAAVRVSVRRRQLFAGDGPGEDAF